MKGERERERKHCVCVCEREKMQRKKKKKTRGNQSEKRWRMWEEASGKRDHLKERREGRRGGTGERGGIGGGDATFRLSSVCFEYMCGADWAESLQYPS